MLTSNYLRTQQTTAPFVERIGRLAHQNPLLHEFDNFAISVIKGLTGEQRVPIREAYWARADPLYRMGPHAETFDEFEKRVQAFRFCRW
jgi:broad specificity phosphatase PhoE